MIVYILLSLLVGLASLTEACEDNWTSEKCELRKSQGRCSTNSYVIANCQLTCELCETETTTTTTTTTTVYEVYHLNIGFPLKNLEVCLRFSKFG